MPGSKYWKQPYYKTGLFNNIVSKMRRNQDYANYVTILSTERARLYKRSSRGDGPNMLVTSRYPVQILDILRSSSDFIFLCSIYNDDDKTKTISKSLNLCSLAPSTKNYLLSRYLYVLRFCSKLSSMAKFTAEKIRFIQIFCNNTGIKFEEINDSADSMAISCYESIVQNYKLRYDNLRMKDNLKKAKKRGRPRKNPPPEIQETCLTEEAIVKNQNCEHFNRFFLEIGIKRKIRDYMKELELENGPINSSDFLKKIDYLKNSINKELKLLINFKI